MGLKLDYIQYINESVITVMDNFQGKYMLELGNQRMCGEFVEKTGKEYYENRGVIHISVDLNGLNGAVKKDLSKPDQFILWHNYFDIITNSGTSEHVEPKRAQYDCFSIIHDCLKVGGLAIHLVPDIDALEHPRYRIGHCGNFYSKTFFTMLANYNSYKLISLKKMDGLICVSFLKENDYPFMKDREIFLNHIARRRYGILERLLNSVARRIINYSS